MVDAAYKGDKEAQIDSPGNFGPMLEIKMGQGRDDFLDRSFGRRRLEEYLRLDRHDADTIVTTDVAGIVSSSLAGIAANPQRVWACRVISGM